MSSGIGALVICHREERNIQACLRSLDFCDERVVVDSFSDDRTLELALPLAEHVYQREFRTHADQKNWGMLQLETPWVLILDADERVPEDLREELLALAREAPADGYWLRRRNRFFGREIRGAGWQRDRVLRFLRRGAGRYPEMLLHEEIELDEGMRVGQCKRFLAHDSNQDWPSSFARLLSYTTRGAAARAQRGKRGGRGRMLRVAPARFLRQYLLQSGWRDGLHGFVLCALSAHGVFLREAKLAFGETQLPASTAAPGGSPRVEVRKGRGVREVAGA